MVLFKAARNASMIAMNRERSVSVKRLWHSKYRNLLFLVCALLFVVAMYLLTDWNSWPKLVLDILYCLLLWGILSWSTKQNNKLLDKMWQLADELHLSAEELSQMSELGRIDLEATRPENRSYFPSRRVVGELVNKLEQLKKRGMV